MTGWLRRNRTSLVLALALGVLSLCAWYFLLPTRLTVAVAADDNQEALALAAYARRLDQQKKHTRLSLLKVAGYREAADALDRGAVDLALVRPDIAYPSNGLTLVVLREEALLIVAPSSKKIDTSSDLNGKQLGVLARDNTDVRVLEVVLEHYGLTAVKLHRITSAEIESSNAGKTLDALAFVATPNSDDARHGLRTAMKAFGSDLSNVALEGLEVLSTLQPAFQETTIAPGTLSFNPKLPKEEVKTATISYRLTASNKLDRIPASNLVQHLIEMRPGIAKEYPSINLMKQPRGDQEMSAALPNHRGAVDYFNREQQTFMDRWGDWLWLGLFALGGFTSIFAWLGQLFIRKRQEVIDHVLDRLVCIITEARTARPVDLNALAEEIDTLVTYAVRHARWRTTGARTMSALIIALDGARAAIMERRRELESRHAALVPKHQLAHGHDLGTP